MQLPNIELCADSKLNLDPSCAVALGWFQAESASQPKKKSDSTQRTPSLKYIGKPSKDLASLTERLERSGHFLGKKNEVSCLRFFGFAGYSNALLLGLGSESKWTLELARQSGAALYAAQKRERFARVVVLGDSVLGAVGTKNLPDYFGAFCEGYLLATYDFRELKKNDPELFVPSSLVFTNLKAKDLDKLSLRAQVIARAVHFARSLGDSPSNILTPQEFTRRIQVMAKEHSMRTTVLGRAEMEKEGMGLFVGVAQGSVQEPQLIIVEHRGGKKTEKPIALVGKGITFDSGGISLKPASRMEDMKYDMMGAAAVAGILQAVGELDLPLNVVGLIAAAENMPDGNAQKPGDVVRSMSGKTVEIINTDAEGRLVLADALEYVQKYFDPQAIVDFATLTGAVVDALGTVTSGVMGNSPELLNKMKESAVATGERVWELPLYDEYEEDLRSNIAEIRNSGVREAGSSKGGTFLKSFVNVKYPWVHCDIAGSAYHRKDVNYHPPKFGSGVMVRLIVHLLENWKALGKKG